MRISRDVAALVRWSWNFPGLGHYGRESYVLTVAGLGLVLLRVLYTLSPHYLFFFWNIILAVIPLYISSYLATAKKEPKPAHWLFWTVSWVLFFPNALYLITDVLHLYRYENGFFLYDLFLVLLFSYIGIRICFQTLYQMQGVMRRHVSALMVWGAVVGLLYLNALGIYIGRVLRWNSWDILWAPHHVFYDVFHRILVPQEHMITTIFTLGLWLASLAGYLLWYLLHRRRSVMTG